MSPDELRALADRLRDPASPDADDIDRAADYLRACADAQPVGWMHPDGRVVPTATMDQAYRDGGAMQSSLRDYTIPLYAAPVPPQEDRNVWQQIIPEDAPQAEPVAIVRVHRTGGNAGIAWSAVPTGAQMMRDGDLLYAAQQQADEREPLRDALKTVIYELAALIPNPDKTLVDDWPCENAADRQCLQIAYTTARSVLHGIGGSDAE